MTDRESKQCREAIRMKNRKAWYRIENSTKINEWERKNRERERENWKNMAHKELVPSVHSVDHFCKVKQKGEELERTDLHKYDRKIRQRAGTIEETWYYKWK